MTMPGGLLDKIGARVFPGQQPMDGLLTEEDIKNAQRQGLLSLGAGLLAGSGPSTEPRGFGQIAGQALLGAQDAHGQAINQSMGRRVQAAQYGQMQMEMQEAKRREAAKQAILAKYPMPETSDSAGLAAWIRQTMSLWTQADPKTATTLGQLLPQLEGKDKNLQAVSAGDRTVLLKPGTTEVAGEIKHGVQPRDNAAGIEQRAEMSRQRTFSREQQMARQYESRTKDYADVADKIMIVKASAEDRTGASDMSLLFAYMKLLDPGSVVRESEYATAQNAGSVPERIRAMYNKTVDGAKLDEKVRHDFVSLAHKLGRNYQRRLSHVMKQYERRARSAGVDPANVAYDYFDGIELGSDEQQYNPADFGFGGAQ